jgi:hypothetical protein
MAVHGLGFGEPAVTTFIGSIDQAKGPVHQANGKPCRPTRARLHYAPKIFSPGRWERGTVRPRGDHCLGEPSRAGAEDTTAPVGDS